MKLEWAEDRPGSNGEFDEVFCKDVSSVHIERMDSGHIWIGIYGAGGRVTIGLHSKKKISGSFEREPFDDVVAQVGEKVGDPNHSEIPNSSETPS